jgi:predicted transcriptional regulator of viral defense system
MKKQGILVSAGRGVYALANRPPQSQPDLVTASRAAPRGVICLVSALAWHRLTDQIPHAVDCAFPRGVRPPRLAHPPIRPFWFSPAAYKQGIEIHRVDGCSVRMYSPEKTIADCFKFRNKIGLDTVLDALRRYRETVGLRSDKLMKYARVCRVQKIMQPYLEASL